jgi:hypothetical protein
MSRSALKETKVHKRAEAETKHAAENAAFVTGLPMRLLELMAQCKELNVDTQVISKDGNIVVGFYHENWNWVHIGTGNDPSQVWEVSNLEADFGAIRELREQEKRKRELAKQVREKLTPEELDALFRYPR